MQTFKPGDKVRRINRADGQGNKRAEVGDIATVRFLDRNLMGDGAFLNVILANGHPSGWYASNCELVATTVADLRPGDRFRFPGDRSERTVKSIMAGVRIQTDGIPCWRPLDREVEILPPVPDTVQITLPRTTVEFYARTVNNMDISEACKEALK